MSRICIVIIVGYVLSYKIYLLLLSDLYTLILNNYLYNPTFICFSDYTQQNELGFVSSKNTLIDTSVGGAENISSGFGSTDPQIRIATDNFRRYLENYLF
jgi:hypothetical protein